MKKNSQSSDLPEEARVTDGRMGLGHRAGRAALLCSRRAVSKRAETGWVLLLGRGTINWEVFASGWPTGIFLIKD